MGGLETIDFGLIIKHINNLVVQDHRGVKRRVRPMPGFQSFRTARNALEGVKLCPMIHKAQYDKTEDANDREYFLFPRSLIMPGE